MSGFKVFLVGANDGIRGLPMRVPSEFNDGFSYVSGYQYGASLRGTPPAIPQPVEPGPPRETAATRPLAMSVTV